MNKTIYKPHFGAEMYFEDDLECLAYIWANKELDFNYSACKMSFGASHITNEKLFDKNLLPDKIKYLFEMWFIKLKKSDQNSLYFYNVATSNKWIANLPSTFTSKFSWV